MKPFESQATYVHEVPLALDRADKIASALSAELGPFCERIEVAGSVRRRVPTVKDIEIVCIPKMERDLFGTIAANVPSELDLHVEKLERGARLAPRLDAFGRTRNGTRYKALAIVRSGAWVDLLMVRPPAQWGAIFAIRTGPWQYSRALVMAAQERGLRCKDGRLLDADGRELATPEERDFIERCGFAYVRPEERRA
jgi:DNA polymerase/3'-5' exonuclease PolX